MNALARIRSEVVACRACPRLVRWRERVARDKVRRHHDEEYWGRPVPGFGDPRARLVLVGLAPAAHGANRTGRMFTGDRSGNWLYRALHKFGYASQPDSESRNDGMKLQDCYITAACRCAPPANKPIPREVAACRHFLLDEFRALHNLRVVVGLGKLGFDAAAEAVQALRWTTFPRKPRFGHLAEVSVTDRITLLGSYHPSQQNTFTGRLTKPMFDAVFRRARRLQESA